MIATEESFEELYERAPCGHVSTDLDGVIRRVNHTFAALTGLPRESLMGMDLRDILTPGSRLFFETRFLPVLHLSGEAREIAFVIACADGTEIPALVNAVIVADEDGRPSGVRLAVFDTSERLDYERQLVEARRVAESSEATIRALQDASSAFGAAMTDDELATALAESARAALSATAAAVILTERDGSLTVVAGRHPLAEAGSPVAHHLEVAALATGAVTTVADLDDAATVDPSLPAAMRGARLEAMMAAPIADDGLRLGAVTCFFGRGRAFDAHDVQLHAALARQAGQVLSRIRLQRQLEQLALHDHLTGLANRAYLQSSLMNALESSRGSGRTSALVFVDLDGFKAINDALGHRAGDAILREVAARLSATVRERDVVSRFGGDEFVVICEDIELEAAVSIAERLRAEVSRPFDDLPPTYRVTASIGIAVVDPAVGAPLDADAALRAADAAMYRSKAAGKDRISVVRL